MLYRANFILYSQSKIRNTLKHKAAIPRNHHQTTLILSRVQHREAFLFLHQCCKKVYSLELTQINFTSWCCQTSTNTLIKWNFARKIRLIVYYINMLITVYCHHSKSRQLGKLAGVLCVGKLENVLLVRHLFKSCVLGIVESPQVKVMSVKQVKSCVSDTFV